MGSFTVEPQRRRSFGYEVEEAVRSRSTEELTSLDLAAYIGDTREFMFRSSDNRS
jgi:hypothetical protein